MNDSSRLDVIPFEIGAAAPDVQIGVSVVMVVYHTGPVLAQSVACVLADPDVDEFVVVDNGSSTAESAMIDATAASDVRVTLVRGQDNVGFARAVNMGAQATHGRVVIVLNPDAFLQPGCVRALVRALKDRPSPCVVGARVLNPDGTEQRGARRGEVTPVTSLLSITGLSKKVGQLQSFEVHHEDDPTPRKSIPVPTISGACFAMRREDFLGMGGLDTHFFLHVEDVDLCWRVRKAGGEVLFEPRAKVVHLGSTSLKWPLKVEFHKGVGLALFFRKRADNVRRRLIAWALTPVIIAVSVARPILRGQAFKNRGGLRF